MIITLIGSTKEQELFEKLNYELSLEEHAVFTVAVFGHKIGMNMSGPEKKALDRGYLKKIDASDAVFILNKDDYIGLGTCDELLYAIVNGKKVIWYEPIDTVKLEEIYAASGISRENNSGITTDRFHCGNARYRISMEFDKGIFLTVDQCLVFNNLQECYIEQTNELLKTHWCTIMEYDQLVDFYNSVVFQLEEREHIAHTVLSSEVLDFRIDPISVRKKILQKLDDIRYGMRQEYHTPPSRPFENIYNTPMLNFPSSADINHGIQILLNVAMNLKSNNTVTEDGYNYIVSKVSSGELNHEAIFIFNSLNKEHAAHDIIYRLLLQINAYKVTTFSMPSVKFDKNSIRSKNYPLSMVVNKEK